MADHEMFRAIALQAAPPFESHQYGTQLRAPYARYATSDQLADAGSVRYEGGS